MQNVYNAEQQALSKTFQDEKQMFTNASRAAAYNMQRGNQNGARNTASRFIRQGNSQINQQQVMTNRQISGMQSSNKNQMDNIRMKMINTITGYLNGSTSRAGAVRG